MATRHPNDPRARFEARVDRTGECHRWTGGHNHKGYGRLLWEGRFRFAHVIALLLAGVTIPPGMTVDHVYARGCRHRDCVRLDHLEVVTQVTNVMRGNSPHAINTRKTHCIHGHEFAGDNLIVLRNGHRRCRACAQRAWQDFAARRKAEATA